jgi:integrase
MAVGHPNFIMARTVRDSSLDSRTARLGSDKHGKLRLPPRGKPYYRLIEPGLHLGYRRPRGRKGKPAGAGVWVVRYYLGSQNYKVEAIGTADDYGDADGIRLLDFSQAQAKARQYALQHAKPSNDGPLTVKAAVETYLEFLESNRKGAAGARTTAVAHIIPQLGDVLVSALTPQILRRWQTALAKAPPRRRTKPGEPQQYRKTNGDEDAIRRRKASTNRVWTILRAALNHAFKDGLVPSDHAWRRVEPFRNVESARLHYLTVEEAKRLINAADEASGFRNLVRAALTSGARYGELCRLTAACWNPDSGTLAIRLSKSGKSRTVHLSPEGRAFFAQLAAGRRGGDLMLPKANGAAWQKSEQARPMAEAVAAAKITEPIGFHSLRHTYASLAVMKGVPLLVLAKNLGHRDTRMVERHYGHLSEKYVADAIRDGAPQFGFEPDSKIASLS